MTWTLDERARPIPVRAERAGSLEIPPTGLMVGKVVPLVPRESDAGARAWLTVASESGAHPAWHRLAEEFAASGLWPLQVRGLWDRSFGMGTGPASVPDAESALQDCWQKIRRVRPDGTLLPHPPWPGFAPASPAVDVETALLPVPPSRWSGALLLVPATRPADSLAQLGWFGACNWSLSGAEIAAVLRSWEDRFGAYVVSIGSAEFDVVVTRPPVTDEQCLLLADEHYCFCPDNYSPQTLAEEVLFSRAEYAERLRGARSWHFWWD
jgi:hypothetical protein